MGNAPVIIACSEGTIFECAALIASGNLNDSAQCMKSKPDDYALIVVCKIKLCWNTITKLIISLLPGKKCCKRERCYV